MLVMVVFFIAFRWIHLSTPLIRLFLLVLILLLMPTLYFLPVWFALCLLRFRLLSRLPMMFVFFFSSIRRHTRYWRDWSSDVCSSDLVVLEARDVHGRWLRGVDLDVHRGEILGIAGLAGAGVLELPYVIAGCAQHAVSGRVR